MDGVCVLVRYGIWNLKDSGILPFTTINKIGKCQAFASHIASFLSFSLSHLFTHTMRHLNTVCKTCYRQTYAPHLLLYHSFCLFPSVETFGTNQIWALITHTITRTIIHYTPTKFHSSSPFSSSLSICTLNTYLYIIILFPPSSLICSSGIRNINVQTTVCQSCCMCKRVFICSFFQQVELFLVSSVHSLYLFPILI